MLVKSGCFEKNKILRAASLRLALEYGGKPEGRLAYLEALAQLFDQNPSMVTFFSTQKAPAAAQKSALALFPVHTAGSTQSTAAASP